MTTNRKEYTKAKLVMLDRLMEDPNFTDFEYRTFSRIVKRYLWGDTWKIRESQKKRRWRAS